MRRLTKFGLGLTAAWISIFGIVVICNVAAVGQMTLNAWGDFLAGASAPLALLWLVIGYFQQGKELRINTKALEAQQKELHLQVKETANLAKNSERQAMAAELLAQISKSEHDRDEFQKILDAQPDFVAEGGRTSGPLVTTKIRNRGGLITDIEIEYEGPHSLDFVPATRFDTDELGQLNVKQLGDSPADSICFRITYTNRFGERHTMAYRLEGHHLRSQTLIET